MFLAFPAEAATDCMPRERLTTILDERYSEKPVAAGLENTGKSMEIFATPDGETWTAVISMADGTSCIIAAGEMWLEKVNHERSF